MSKSEKKKIALLKTLWVLCATLPLFSAIIRFITFRAVSITDIQNVLLLSCSAIIMLPFFIEASRLVFTLTAITLLWDFIYIIINAMYHKNIYHIHDITYLCAIIIPTQICIFSIIRSKVMDENYIAASVSGWDSARGYLRISFALIFQPLAFLSLLGMPLLGDNKLLYTLLLIFTVLFFLFLYIRSFIAIQWLWKDSLRHTYRSIGVQFKPEKKDICDNEMNILFERMLEKMENEKLYLLPSLTIEDLSKALYTNRGYLSNMINKCTGMNFNNLINKYRVRHAMELFKDNPKMKVNDLMGMSGFNNPVTFNNAFKLVMKSTPGEWCNSHREKLHLLNYEEKSPEESDVPAEANDIAVNGN